MTVASPLGNVTGPATTAGSFAATESGLRPGCAPAVGAAVAPAAGAGVAVGTADVPDAAGAHPSARSVPAAAATLPVMRYTRSSRSRRLISPSS